MRADRDALEHKLAHNEQALVIASREEALRELRASSGGLVDSLARQEAELADMRAAMHAFLVESTGSDAVLMRDLQEEHTVAKVMRSLLQRLKEVEEQGSKSDALESALMAIAQGSASVSARVQQLMEEQRSADAAPAEVVVLWARRMVEEVGFLQELRLQRDELFEIKLRTLHSVYTQARGGGDSSAADRFGNIVEHLQREIGIRIEELRERDADLAQRDCAMRALHQRNEELERQVREQRDRVLRLEEFCSVDSADEYAGMRERVAGAGVADGA